MRATILAVMLVLVACGTDEPMTLEGATELVECPMDFGHPGIVCDRACIEADRLDERDDLCGCPADAQARWGEWVGCCLVKNAGTAPHLTWDQCVAQ